MRIKSKLTQWVKNTGIVHSLVLYKCDMLDGLYGVRIPFWYKEKQIINAIVDQMLEVYPYEPTSELIAEWRRGNYINIVAVW